MEQQKHPHKTGGRDSQSGRGHERAHARVRLPAELTRKMTPEEINRLPLASYRGPLHLVHTPHEAAKAARILAKERLLGFDTETRPAFTKGESYPPAMLQLASGDEVYLFHLQRLGGLPEELAAVLSDRDIIKAGVSIAHDVKELKRMTPFEPQGFFDIGECAKRAGIQHHGLRGLAAVLLGFRISKGRQMTNWERSDLPREALSYAATDAWIGRRVYLALSEKGCIPGQGRAKRGIGPLVRSAIGHAVRLLRLRRTRK